MKIPRIRGGAAATLSLALAAAALAAMAPSQALSPTGVGPRDPSRAGFPAFYTDDSGVALQLCVDGSLRCGGATVKSDGAGGPGVGVAPDGEGFYFLATTTLTTPTLTLDVEFAAEAAWAAPGKPITFDRLRFRGHSDVAGPISVTTPYGTFTVNAGDPAQQVNINRTQDVGCGGASCDFSLMTTKVNAHITNWITSTTAPAGYIGNSVSSTPATVGGVPATISAGGASTDRWVVMGKVAPANRVSLPATLTFRKAATKSVTMRNLGTGPRTISAVTLAGSKTFKTLATSTCKSGTVLNVGARCKVDVRYRPGAVKRSAAKLTIADDIGTNSVRVKGF